MTCCRFRGDPEVGVTTQLRFVDCSVRRRRNRTRIGTNFLATLPEAFCDECNDEGANLATQLALTSADTEDPGSAADLGGATGDNPETSADSAFNSSFDTPEQSGKLQKVLTELKLAALNIPDSIRKRLIQVVKKNIDAFAG